MSQNNRWVAVPGIGDDIRVRRRVNWDGSITLEFARRLKDGQWSFNETDVPGTRPEFRGYAIHDELEHPVEPE